MPSDLSKIEDAKELDPFEAAWELEKSKKVRNRQKLGIIIGGAVAVVLIAILVWAIDTKSNSSQSVKDSVSEKADPFGGMPKSSEENQKHILRIAEKMRILGYTQDKEGLSPMSKERAMISCTAGTGLFHNKVDGFSVTWKLTGAQSVSSKQVCTLSIQCDSNKSFPLLEGAILRELQRVRILHEDYFKPLIKELIEIMVPKLKTEKIYNEVKTKVFPIGPFEINAIGRILSLDEASSVTIYLKFIGVKN